MKIDFLWRGRGRIKRDEILLLFLIAFPPVDLREKRFCRGYDSIDFDPTQANLFFTATCLVFAVSFFGNTIFFQKQKDVPRDPEQLSESPQIGRSPDYC